ncbi:protein AIM2 [Sporobolomyces salmoneus]|uniref:protein AIM2 n=1 Tax=Sporobolomyces salmoneus TaxID=183962 RepID=UPI0031744170
MSLSSCCATGFIHEGTPVGSIKEVGGVRTYVTLPKGDYDKTKALLFFTDIFGVDTMPNGLLLADSFAANGYATYVVDYLKGDPASMEAYAAGKLDLGVWLQSHSPKEVALPLVDKVQDALKSEGVKRFGCVSFCYGGRVATDKVLNDTIDVAITAHPSLLQVPEDIEALNKKSTPYLFNTASEDGMFTPELAKKSAEILNDNKAFTFIDYEGGHGFAIRADPSDPKQRKSADDCFENSVGFLKKHL